MDTDEQGRRLLDPIIYEPLIVDGKRIGYVVPAGERADWDALAEQHAKHLGVYAKAPGTKRLEVKPLEELVELLKPWVIDYNLGLDLDLSSAYKVDAEKVTRLVLSIVQGCEAQRIHSPGGVLRSRLNELRRAQADPLS